MSERKTRIAAFGNRADVVRNYERQYLDTLRELMLSVPEQQRSPPITVLAPVGMAEIWPCTDAAVVLVYPSEKLSVRVVVRGPLATTAEEFMQKNPACELLDSAGNRSTLRPVITSENVRSHVVGHMLDIRINDKARVFRPRFMRLSVVGWDASLPDPFDQARKHFSAALLARNILGPQAVEMSSPQMQAATRKKAREILERYDDVLRATKSEEDLQRFLFENPAILYPDYVKRYSKLRLGDDYITDFVFDVQGHNGREYVFVELEKPTKLIFTSQGYFTAYFTQAKDQLLNWERWISANQAYIIQKLPGLFKPSFHLVMGRSADLLQTHREKLRTEFATTSRTFSTYDDLLRRYRQILDQLKD